jgi:hypothetical protein
MFGSPAAACLPGAGSPSGLVFVCTLFIVWHLLFFGRLLFFMVSKIVLQ